MQNLSKLNQNMIYNEICRRDELEKFNKIDEKEFEIITNEERQIKILTLDSVDSTNNTAKKYIEKINEENKDSKNIRDNKLYVFAANIQTKGRGRRGNNWLSANEESLSVSFLTKVNDNIKNLPPITAAAALAVSNTLNEFNLRTNIKWPNDVLVKDKKIAGILSELILADKNNAYVVIGCGINLNNKSFAEEISQKATSYFKETGSELDKNIFLVEFIENMDYYINRYFSNKREEIIKIWKENLNIISKKAKLIHQGKIYKVFIKDVLNSGEIIAELEDGSLKKFQSSNTSFKYNSNENND